MARAHRSAPMSLPLHLPPESLVAPARSPHRPPKRQASACPALFLLLRHWRARGEAPELPAGAKALPEGRCWQIMLCLHHRRLVPNPCLQEQVPAARALDSVTPWMPVEFLLRQPAEAVAPVRASSFRLNPDRRSHCPRTAEKVRQPSRLLEEKSRDSAGAAVGRASALERAPAAD